ncbi:glycosyltransferase family 4 protein [Methylomagnum sp.]
MSGLQITCVIYSLGCGGAERVMAGLVRWLADAGHRVSLLILNPAIPAHYEVPDTVTRIGPQGAAAASCRWFDWSCQRRRRRDLRKTILDTAPELVISFMDTTNVAVLRALSGSGVPVIATEHNDPRMHPIGWRWSLLRRLTYPQASRVTLLTADAAGWAETLWPGWRVAVMPNPVEPPSRPPQAEPPAQFGRHTIAAMGRLVPQKGFDLLIEAFATLAPRFGDWHLVVFGEGAERAALERQIAQLGLEGRVSLPGVVKAPETILPLADLFAVSSRYEGFCLVLAEAMALGLPVISFNCPTGPSEIVRDGEDGLLVPPEDTDALAAAMARLMTDEAERRRLGQNARQAAQRYAPARIMAEWETLIAEVMAEARGAASRPKPTQGAAP